MTTQEFIDAFWLWEDAADVFWAGFGMQAVFELTGWAIAIVRYLRAPKGGE